ncbi:hypothetical protein ACLBXM_22645 [Xanthobacteraceae bacterium A53D]
MVVFDGELMADYHQIYLADAAAPPALAQQWTEETVRRRMLADARMVTFSTARNMTVPVCVELHTAEPKVDVASSDHAVQGSLTTSGMLVIAGLTDYLPDAKRISVPAGRLCALALSTGLGTLSANGLEGADRYTVHLWPCEQDGVTVLRQWPGD